METKLAKLVAAMNSGDLPGALRIASKFARLGDERAAITRARDAYLRPDFYRQIGKDPEILVREGEAALKRRYRKQLGEVD